VTVSVFVEVPGHAEFTAEVTTVERTPDGRPGRLWRQVLKPGEASSFYPHDGASVFVAEGHVGGELVSDSLLTTVFAFALGEQVGLVGSDEHGTVIAQAEYAESARNYLIRYRAGDGRLTESWWSETAIVSANAPHRVEAPLAREAIAADPAQAAPEASPSSSFA